MILSVSTWFKGRPLIKTIHKPRGQIFGVPLLSPVRGHFYKIRPKSRTMVIWPTSGEGPLPLNCPRDLLIIPKHDAIHSWFVWLATKM